MAQRHHYSPLLGALALASLLVTGCTEDPVFSEKTVQVKAQHMPVLAGEAYYKLWFSYPGSKTSIKTPSPNHGDGAFFSVGEFKIGSDGSMTNLSGGPATFAIPQGYNPNLIIDAIVTVEHTASDSKSPGSRMLAAPFKGTAQQAFARLELTDADAFGNKMRRDSTGFALLDAPTGTGAANAAQGIWFVRFVSNGSGTVDTLPGLTLAPMPLNTDNPYWTYQTWLVKDGGTTGEEYIKLGRFIAPNRPDSNGAGAGAGAFPTRIHSAPGEDFINGTPRTLNDGSYGLVISAEPSGIELARPLIPVLKIDRIENGIAPGMGFALGRPDNPPYLEVTVDR